MYFPLKSSDGILIKGFDQKGSLLLSVCQCAETCMGNQELTWSLEELTAERLSLGEGYKKDFKDLDIPWNTLNTIMKKSRD